MAFRYEEAYRNGYDEALSYLVSLNIDSSQRARSREAFDDIVEQCGPVVRGYPSWHPLVSNHDPRQPVTTPEQRCGYNGLDHSRFFTNGFITCPYHDGEKVIASVKNLCCSSIAEITAERLDVQFYSPMATPILVRCRWKKELLQDGTIPASLAVPLILTQELSLWENSEVAETWETMRPYLLGTPHGSRSSLFINKETGLKIKKIWESLINTGMFGPIMVG